MLFESKCLKFFYEFFYSVFKVGLNAQQNSPATLFCYKKFHSKIELKFRRNCTKQTCLCLFRVLAGTEIFIFHHALNSGTSILHVNFMENMFLRALIWFVLLQIVRFVKGQIICCFVNFPDLTKDRKGLTPPKRTEKNFGAPKRTFIIHFYAILTYV